MRVEEGHLLIHSSLDRDLILDILLGSVLDSDEAQPELDLLIHDHAFGIGTSVHNIDLRDNTDSSDALRIDSTRHTQTFLSSHICVGGDDAENDCSGVRDIPLGHGSRDLLNICRLAFNRNERDAWQIDQG